MKRIKLIVLFIALSCFIIPLQAKYLKVLAIGNSFSVDAVEQNLYELAIAQGDTLLIGNAYIGGCSIDRHWSNAQTQKAEYSYRKIVGGVRVVRDNVNLANIVKDEDWDIITVQQSSPLSGKIESYNHLPDLMNYVRSIATNKQFRFAFHMTWAYAGNSTHSAFVNYDCNQIKMYEAILQAVHQAVEDNHINLIVPSGIAVQRARAVIGDSLCRDGYHLSYTIGRYTAACTWCEFLIGKSVVGNLYHPKSISPSCALIAQYSAHQAIHMVTDTALIKAHVLVGNLFFKDMPMSLEVASRKASFLSDNAGNSLIYIPEADLTDNDKMYAIPLFMVRGGSSLLEAAKTFKRSESSTIVIAERTGCLKVGDKIASFNVTDLNGKHYTDKNTLSKPLIMNFWYTGCGPCLSEMPELSTWMDIFPQATYLAVTWNKADDILNIVARRHFRFNQIASNKKLWSTFKVRFTPTTVLVDKQGVICTVMIGASQQKRDILLHTLLGMYQ